MYFLPTSAILIGYSLATAIYLSKHAREKIDKKLFVNELFIVLLFLFAGITFPFIYQFHSESLPINTLYVLWISTSIFFIIEMVVWAATLIYNTIISKKNPEIMAKRDYSDYVIKVNERWDDSLKSEFGRKILHVFTSSVILVFWSIGTLLEANGFLSLFGLDNYSFSFWVIIIIGYGFVIMFQIADLARLTKFYMLPNWARKWYLDMRPRESDTFIASTPLVLAFVPFLFVPFPIFASVALIATVADAAACLVGKKFGSHELRKGSNKTIEGFFAGGICTFLIVIIVLTIYNSILPIDMIKVIAMAVIATIVFLAVDYFTINISDNILNPLLIGISMWLIAIF